MIPGGTEFMNPQSLIFSYLECARGYHPADRCNHALSRRTSWTGLDDWVVVEQEILAEE